MAIKKVIVYSILGLFGTCSTLLAEQPLRPVSLSFVTFNTGLARFYVSDYSIRRQQIMEKLPSLDDDVICLQEVWNTSDLNEFAAKLSQQYPFAHFITVKKLLIFPRNDGLMILSRWPIVEQAAIELDSFLIPRRALWVKIQVGDRQLGIACSHLSATIHGFPYWGKFDSVEDEQVAQVEAITKEFAPLDVLLGDWNSGPAIGDQIQAFTQRPYEKTLEAGFWSPLVQVDPPVCTWCEENPLVEKGYGNLLIDHVFLNHSLNAKPVVVERIFTEKIDLGEQVTRLSDHYGVRVRIAWPDGHPKSARTSP